MQRTRTSYVATYLALLGKPNRLIEITYTSLAGAVGIEPTYAVLEAAVLPLDDTPVNVDEILPISPEAGELPFD